MKIKDKNGGDWSQEKLRAENTRALNEFIRVKYLLCFTGIGEKEHIEGRGGGIIKAGVCDIKPCNKAPGL